MTRSSLSPAKQALLERRLRARAAKVSVPRRDPGTAPPPSAMQERLWFLEQYAPGTAAYTVPFAARLTGELDENALVRALTELTRRHESLRTSLVTTPDGRPETMIAEEPVVEFRVTADPGEIDGELARPFDLARPPLLRALLVRSAPEETTREHVLLLTMHHAITDGWSCDILFQELLALHAGRELPPVPLQFGDYAHWQRGRTFDDDVGYWVSRLDGVPALELPTDLPRPAEQRWTGAAVDVIVDPALTASIAELGQAHRATPYMTLLAAFQVLLGRFAGQDDFAVGSPVSGRELPELEGVVGPFINTLAMRADLRGDPTFRDLLGRVRDTTLDAFAHQALPFDRLVTELAVERDVSRTPVYQTMFALQNYRGRTLDTSGLGAEPYPIPTVASRFDLALYLFEGGGGLHGQLAYSTALFREDTARRLVGCLETLLRAAVADPGLPISRLPLLGPDERRRVLALGVAEPAPPAGIRLLHEVVAGQDPEAVAVVAGDVSLTYGELGTRADRLARRLRALGAGPGERVAVCLEQSAGLAVAVLGVLKAGAAYLPLDPEHPGERLAYVVSDAGVRIAVTDASSRGRLPDGLVTVGLDEPDGDLDGHEVVPVDVTPDDLAYVIYTSGTTGRPKGVAIQHRQALVYLAGLRERLEIEPGGSYGLLQSLAFDFGVTVFYACLMTGGTLHIIAPRTAGHELAEYVRDAGIDYLKITPSHLAALQADVLPRKLLILGGEAAPRDWAEELAASGRCRVVNHYGPTEATVGVTTYPVEGTGGTTTTLPIGRPLPGARAYVLDEHLEPVPIGVAGELYLGGDRLARGYLDRPALTAERFLPDPYGPAGARMYRTGDLARHLPDGNLEFLGRRDLQVKIRGYRVELAEVESVLGGCPGVTSAIADMRGGLLVAYLVGEPGAENRPEAAEVRTWLAERLPDYMIPARYVWLDQPPPLKSHGKVDRAALPDPAPETTGRFEPPRTAAEQTAAAVWAELLGVPEVGATDDFFELGGHSLLAMRVVARLRQVAPERTVTVLDLFKHRTVRELAALLESAGEGPRRLLHRLTPARTAASTVICAPYGGGSAVIYQPLADALPADWALYSIAVPGHELGEEARPLDEVADGCVQEILDGIEGPVTLYGHCGLGVMLIAEIARRLEDAGREVEAVYLGGVFPFARPRGRLAGLTELMERIRGDQAWIDDLRAAGLDVEDVGRDQLDLMVRNRRRGTRQAERYFTRMFEEAAAPLRAPVIALAGERDPAMEFYQERYREWHVLSEQTALVVLDEAGHFFLKYRAEELAAIVTGTHRAIGGGRADRLARTPRSTWWLEGVSSGDSPASGTSGARRVRPSMGRFTLVAAGQLVSILGSALTEFAVPLWIYTTTGSLVNFALFAVLGLLPGMLVAPLAGAIVDRHDRRVVMLAGDVTAGGVQLILGVLLWTGNLEIWHVYPLLALLSVALTFQRLAYGSAIPQLVPKRFLGHANGVVQLVTGTAQVAVPLVAVGLMAVIGLEGILIIDVLSYGFAIAVLLAVRFPRSMAWRRRETVMAEIAGGWRLTWGNRGFRGMLVFFAVLNVFLSPLFLMISPLVLSFATLRDVGQVSLAGGIGVLAGGLLMAVWGGPRRRRLRGVLLFTLALAVFCVVAGVRADLVLITAGAFGMSLFLTLLNGVYATIIQVKVPQRFHGRVIALNTLVAWSTLPIGFGLVAPYGAAVFDPLMAPDGPLATTAGALLGTGDGRGIGLMYVAFGLAIALIAVCAMRVRVLARFDAEVPDALPDDLVGIQELRRRAGGES
ncbi:amino acid adenylation domain-containing protein [Nonomuraea polychroma]|uniref:Amino acid adenylation domain-containing protein n=1 Tax=Nonomuraea polychroma TaxID=46176 RepID=A0A438M086_9ACTN|nr:non-ribosomal peptide synthetase/MFS transporter [Nonomuraea polychroma]RVX39027.1 amino acid adenylation domain-containing protein [Nonomuraea polychroma]